MNQTKVIIFHPCFTWISSKFTLTLPETNSNGLHPENRPGKGPQTETSSYSDHPFFSGDILASGREFHHILSYVRSQFLDVLPFQPESSYMCLIPRYPTMFNPKHFRLLLLLGVCGEKPSRNNTWPLFLCLRDGFCHPFVAVAENWKHIWNHEGRWS